MASNRRRSLFLGLVGTGLLALGWLSLPRWLPVVAGHFLARIDVGVESFQIDRPDADGLVVSEAILNTPLGRLRIAGALLRFDSNARPSLDITAASLALEARASSGDAAAAKGATDVAASAPVDLLSRLPLAHLEIGSLSVVDTARAATLRGRLIAETEEARFSGAITYPHLAEPISVDASISSRNEISLELAYGDARAVATATLARAAQALKLAGHLSFEGHTPEHVALEGDVPFGLRLHAQAPTLTIEPGTTLTMKTDAGDLRLASEQGFEISLEDSKLASRGALAATANLARDLDALPLANTRVDIRLENVRGRPVAPSAAIRLEMHSQALGELSAAAEVAPASTHLAIASGAELSGTLSVPDGPTLEGLTVRTRKATRIPLAAPASTLLQIIATADQMTLGDVRLPLRGLEVDAHWTPSAAEPNALGLTAKPPGSKRRHALPCMPSDRP